MDAFTSHFRADKQAKKNSLNVKEHLRQVDKQARNKSSSRLVQDGEEQLCGMGQCLQPGGRGGGGGAAARTQGKTLLSSQINV